MACRAAAVGRIRKYRVAHPEEVVASARKYHVEHREGRNESCRKYDAEHRVETKERMRKYHAEHREETAARGRVARARKAKATGTHTTADVRAQYKRQRGVCFWCPEKVGDTYHIDHVVPLILGGSNGKENIVIACPTCNLTKNARHPMDFAGVLC